MKNGHIIIFDLKRQRLAPTSPAGRRTRFGKNFLHSEHQSHVFPRATIRWAHYESTASARLSTRIEETRLFAKSRSAKGQAARIVPHPGISFIK